MDVSCIHTNYIHTYIHTYIHIHTRGFLNVAMQLIYLGPCPPSFRGRRWQPDRYQSIGEGLFIHTYIHTYIHYLNSPLITHTHDLGHPRGASAVTGCGEPGQHSRPSGHHRENGRGKTQTESAETDPGCPERGVMPHTYIHTYIHTYMDHYPLKHTYCTYIHT